MAKSETIRDQVISLDPTGRALGVVSLLNDFSSELAVRTLPLFLAYTLSSASSFPGPSVNTLSLNLKPKTDHCLLLTIFLKCP